MSGEKTPLRIRLSQNADNCVRGQFFLVKAQDLPLLTDFDRVSREIMDLERREKANHEAASIDILGISQRYFPPLFEPRHGTYACRLAGWIPLGPCGLAWYSYGMSSRNQIRPHRIAVTFLLLLDALHDTAHASFAPISLNSSCILRLRCRQRSQDINTRSLPTRTEELYNRQYLVHRCVHDDLLRRVPCEAPSRPA